MYVAYEASHQSHRIASSPGGLVIPRPSLGLPRTQDPAFGNIPPVCDCIMHPGEQLNKPELPGFGANRRKAVGQSMPGGRRYGRGDDGGMSAAKHASILEGLQATGRARAHPIPWAPLHQTQCRADPSQMLGLPPVLGSVVLGRR